MSTLPTGKLPAPLLRQMLARLPGGDPRVVIGPRSGEDAAVLDMGDRYLVVTTDPITFATDRIGWYSVHVNANDVAVLGATPRWFFAVLLLPEGRSASLAASVMDDIADTCHQLGVTVCGGHTEITTGLDRPIVVGQMMGEAAREELVRKDRLEAGDVLLLTRGVAIEGTALLAREKQEAIAACLSPDALHRAQNLLFDPGISVVDAARVAARTGRVKAMHDPTEGGLVSALWELAQAGGCGLRVEASSIPILPETRTICAALRIDPLRLIASGSLLVAAAAHDAGAIVGALQTIGVPVAEIGRVVPAEEGIEMRVSGRWTTIEPADRDEIARAFDQ